MTDNSEYDALGELIRQRLENHRIPVDDNDWDEIRRQLGKGKDNVAIWSWRIGVAAAAASIALLFIFNRSETEEADITLVSQQATTETSPPALSAGEGALAPSTTNKMNTVAPLLWRGVGGEVSQKNDNLKCTQSNTVEPSDQQNQSDIQQESETELQIPLNAEINQETNEIEDILLETNETEVALLNKGEDEKPAVTQLFNYSVIPDDDEAAVRKSEKWLLAAAFGTGGNTGRSEETKAYQPNSGNSSVKMGLSGRDNRYAAELSGNVQSFSNMSREDFSNIRHRPPLSFGLTARKSPERNVGMESGLVYSCLSSFYEWSGHDVQQNLHYLGVPINMVVNLWNTNPDWCIYLSGGCMVEKGLRAVYRQERQIPGEHRITTVRSHIAGLQVSFSSALGCIYKLEKGWGIYFEPRVGYSFGENQPVSIRTEYPLYFSINLGLNYEL